MYGQATESRWIYVTTRYNSSIEYRIIKTHRICYFHARGIEYVIFMQGEIRNCIISSTNYFSVVKMYLHKSRAHSLQLTNMIPVVRLKNNSIYKELQCKSIYNHNIIHSCELGVYESVGL